MTTMIGAQAMCMSKRGGYPGRIVMVVTGMTQAGTAACATLSSGRDIIYNALVARARG
jgi:hypothetical protein